MTKSTILGIILISFLALTFSSDAIARGGGHYGSRSGKPYSYRAPRASGFYSPRRSTYRSRRPTFQLHRGRSYVDFRTPRYKSSFRMKHYHSHITPRRTFIPYMGNSLNGTKLAIDGDTFYSEGIRYRVRGIDTPEMGNPRAERAHQRLQQLLNSGVVSVQTVAIDKYGRTVAVVKVNGRDVAEILQSEGYAK